MAFPLPPKSIPPKLMADAVLSQANPVSLTWYTVLNTTRNARIISIAENITWATTQPTPLEIKITVDGLTAVFAQTNPVTATYYEVHLLESADIVTQVMAAAGTYSRGRSFLLEGRSIKVEARVTWATTQPTPLVCRVRYAKY